MIVLHISSLFASYQSMTWSRLYKDNNMPVYHMPRLYKDKNMPVCHVSMWHVSVNLKEAVGK